MRPVETNPIAHLAAEKRMAGNAQGPGLGVEERVLDRPHRLSDDTAGGRPRGAIEGLVDALVSAHGLADDKRGKPLDHRPDAGGAEPLVELAPAHHPVVGGQLDEMIVAPAGVAGQRRDACNLHGSLPFLPLQQYAPGRRGSPCTSDSSASDRTAKRAERGSALDAARRLRRLVQERGEQSAVQRRRQVDAEKIAGRRRVDRLLLRQEGEHARIARQIGRENVADVERQVGFGRIGRQRRDEIADFQRRKDIERDNVADHRIGKIGQRRHGGRNERGVVPEHETVVEQDGRIARGGRECDDRFENLRGGRAGIRASGLAAVPSLCGEIDEMWGQRQARLPRPAEIDDGVEQRLRRIQGRGEEAVGMTRASAALCPLRPVCPLGLPPLQGEGLGARLESLTPQKTGGDRDRR